MNKPEALGQKALEKAISKHLNTAQMPNFDDYLLKKIVAKIEYKKQLKQLLPKLWIACAVFIFSLGLMVVACAVFWRAFVQTSIFEFLSLTFTDFKIILDNWQDYSFSILESLPLGATAFLLGSLLASLWLINFSVNQLSKFRKLLSAGHELR